jgi:hypothetical protein
VAPIYPFTTENLAGYFPLLKLAGKTVLTVSGSGDHVLNAVFYGAARVDAFDVNLLSMSYTELKMTGLNFLSYDDFLAFFSLSPENRMVLSKGLYDRFSSSLSPSTKNIFDLFYRSFNGQGRSLRNSHLFYNRPPVDHQAAIYNAYLHSPRQYLPARNALKTTACRFYQSNVTSLVQSLEPSTRYDVILLSNIADYAHFMYPGKDHLNQFARQIIHPLAGYLAEGGLICVACLFKVDDPQSHEAKNDMYLDRKRRDILPTGGLRYSEIRFPGAISGYLDELILLRKTASPAAQF